MKHAFTLRKEEKLRHKNLVDKLFANGKSLYDYPLRMVWRRLTTEELENHFRSGVPEKVGKLQLLITVPKKKRRHAVDRVLMRRRIREAYRLNRLPLKELIENRQEIAHLGLAFIYIAEENLDYALVESKMQHLLHKLEKKLKNDQETEQQEETHD